MGFLSDLYEGGKAVLGFAVKAVAAVVTVAVSAAKAVGKAVVETAVAWGNNIKKVMAPVLDTAARASNYIGQEFDKLKRKILDLLTDKSKKVLVEEKEKLLEQLRQQRAHIERMEEQLKQEQAATAAAAAAAKNNHVNQKPSAVIIGDTVRETKDLEEKLERDILLDELQGVAEALIVQATKIEKEERMQEIQNLARLNVSKDVLLQLTQRPESIRIHDRRFVELIGKFIANDIKKDTELDEFDSLIFERTSKSLLSIGNAHLTKLYTDQEKLLTNDTSQLKADLEEATRKRNSLRRGLTMKEQGWETYSDKIANLEEAIKALENELASANEHLYVTRTILSATEGIQKVVENPNEEEWEEFDVIDTIKICNLFIRLRHEDRRPTLEELQEIEEFGRMIRARDSGFEEEDELDGLSPVPVF